MTPRPEPAIAIACGGTGGHLFPGLAVAEQLVRRGCPVVLMISPKEVDQQAVRTAAGMQVVTLPAVGFSAGRRMAFAWGFVRSYLAARACFKQRPPCAALAMGGFTSAPPILAARRRGARTFLHESNTIPGRANRWLARVVDQAFVGFPQAAGRLRCRSVAVTGTPVRSALQPVDPYTCRVALGLDPERPVLLVMGGSQGAGGINELMLQTLPLLREGMPNLQLLHLAGPADAGRIRSSCEALGIKAVVHGFFSEMELALGAATAAVSRAGASSLAELAALRIPSVLIPYPAATDNHQFHNARAFEETGAARLLEQRSGTPGTLAGWIRELVENSAAREAMRSALAQWHSPKAAAQIADALLQRADSPVSAADGRAQPAPGGPPRPQAAPERQRLSAA